MGYTDRLEFKLDASLDEYATFVSRSSVRVLGQGVRLMLIGVGCLGLFMITTLTLFVVSNLINGERVPLSMLIPAIFGVAFTLIAFGRQLWLKPALKKQLRGLGYTGSRFTMDVVIDSDGMTFASPSASAAYKWDYFDRYEVDGDLLCLWFGSRPKVLLPNFALPDHVTFSDITKAIDDCRTL